MSFDGLPCGLCPTCKYYTFHSGSSAPHRCSGGSSIVREEAHKRGDCTKYQPK